MEELSKYINESIINENWQRDFGDKLDKLDGLSYDQDKIHKFMRKNNIKGVDGEWVAAVIGTFAEYANSSNHDWGMWNFKGSEEEAWQNIWNDDFADFLANDRDFGNLDIIEDILSLLPDLIEEI